MVLSNSEIVGLGILGPLLLWQSYSPNPRILKMAGISVIGLELFGIFRSSQINKSTNGRGQPCTACSTQNPPKTLNASLYPNPVSSSSSTQIRKSAAHPLRQRSYQGSGASS